MNPSVGQTSYHTLGGAPPLPAGDTAPLSEMQAPSPRTLGNSARATLIFESGSEIVLPKALRYLPNPPAFRMGMPGTKKLGWMYRFELLGNLAARVHEALTLDVKGQGVAVPPPELHELQLRRRWVLLQGSKLGYAGVGSYVGFLQTSVLSWLWAARSAHHRAKRDIQEFLVAAHEMTHSIGQVVSVASEHLSKGFPIQIRRGLLLMQPVSKSALFHSLEEVNACLTELRVAKQLGLSEIRDTIRISTTRSTPFLTRAERRRLSSLLREFSFGEDTFLGGRSIELKVPGLIGPSGTRYKPCGAQLALLGGVEAIVHSAIGMQTPESSLAAYSRILSSAHAGDFWAFKRAVGILREAVGSDGVRILSLVWPSVRKNANLVPFVAEALALPTAKRDLYLKQLHQLVTGELALTEALREGRVPAAHQVQRYLARSGRWAGGLREWYRFALCHEVSLPERFAKVAVAASIGALARGEQLKAYRILLNSQLPASSWPPEVAREIKNVSLLQRTLAQLERATALAYACLSSKF